MLLIIYHFDIRHFTRHSAKRDGGLSFLHPLIMSEQIKNIVREKYAEIAHQDKTTNETTCCGMGPTGGTYTIMADSYANLPGYNPDADLGLGCGLPTEFARIQPGDTVLDLGSGAGNGCFVARAETGAEGKVIGVDFTPAMIRRARENAEKLGYNNVEFRQGDIEDLPLSDQSVDVVVSNCVLNLVPNKAKVFAEIQRVLRPGGRLFGLVPDHHERHHDQCCHDIVHDRGRTGHHDLLDRNHRPTSRQLRRRRTRPRRAVRRRLPIQ